jgi:hypothetical protein
VVTISSISYSTLVPLFHAQSRWVNIGGQVPIRPRVAEYARARQLLDSPLPRFLLVPANAAQGEQSVPPAPDAPTWALIDEVLAEHGLAAVTRRCETLRTNLLPHGTPDPSQPPAIGAFWLCPLELVPVSSSAQLARWSDPYADVFARVEAACPRHFPAGDAETRQYTGFWQRYYMSSDMRLIVDGSGNVLYRYFRHFTPVRIADVKEVRAPGWTMPCARLKGRYQPPWVVHD